MKPNVIQRLAASGNYAFGRRLPISRITFHHIAGDAPAAISRFQTAGVQVSAHYVIGSDGTIYQCVDEMNTAYCDGNADSNARTISIEHAGGIASVPYTDAMYAASANLVRYLIGKYGITDFQRHCDVIDKTAYPGGTACPGLLDVDRIIKAAQGGSMATDALTKEEIVVIYDGFFDVDDYQVPGDIINAYVGKPLGDLLTLLHADPTWLKHKAAVNGATSPQATERQLAAERAVVAIKDALSK
jgi:hypothetical protein